MARKKNEQKETEIIEAGIGRPFFLWVLSPPRSPVYIRVLVVPTPQAICEVHLSKTRDQFQQIFLATLLVRESGGDGLARASNELRFLWFVREFAKVRKTPPPYFAHLDWGGRLRAKSRGFRAGIWLGAQH